MNSKVLTDFSDDAPIRDWVSVNDGVMGGLSDGGFRITYANTLEFSGTLSLENNGGFSSIRTQPSELDLTGYDAIVVRVDGDGRSYSLDLRTRSTGWASTYRAKLATTGEGWQDVRIPLSTFTYTRFGQPDPNRGPIAASEIIGVGFTLSDKQPGPFMLKVDKIYAEASDTVIAERTGSPPNDIVATAQSAGDFGALLAAATAAGLVDALQGKGPLTVFAPNDAAFKKLPETTVESLLKPETKDQLVALLSYHVVAGALRLGSETATTLQGNDLSIAPERLSVNGARILTADIEASNGLIHVIDSVLLPPETQKTPESDALAVIRLAIERGVPLFNAGQAAACAAIYEVALDAVARAHTDILGDAERTLIDTALTQVRERQGDETRDAWTLRHALDAIAVSLERG